MAKPKSGAQRRRERVARGLPRYSPGEAERRKAKDRLRSRTRRPGIDLAAVKLDRGCIDCGYRGHPAALHFDHLPGFVKRFELHHAAGYSDAAILAEMEKCEVVCANCHAVRTCARRRQVALRATPPAPYQLVIWEVAS